MDELSWLRGRARDEERLRLEELEPRRLERLEEEFGPEAVLERQHDACYALSRVFFRAALFEDAAHWFRKRQDVTRRLADWLSEQGQPDAAQQQVEELARQSWAVGDLSLFRRYVREGCEPTVRSELRLDVYPAMFLSWAVLSEPCHPHYWVERFEEAIRDERAAIRRRWAGRQRDVAQGVLVDARLGLAHHWQGRFEEALEHAGRALSALESWGRARPEGLSLPHKRVQRQRMAGLVALHEGRERRERLGAAVTHFRKALVATALTRCLDWNDLVILHLTALAWRDASDPIVAEFERAFPHVAHLLAQERQWTGSEAEVNVAREGAAGA